MRIRQNRKQNAKFIFEGKAKVFSSSIIILSTEIKMAIMCFAMVQKSVAYTMSTQTAFPIFFL